MKVTIDSLYCFYDANIKITDKVSIKNFCNLAFAYFDSKIKSLNIEVSNNNPDYMRPYIKIEMLDEDNNLLNLFNSANGLHIETSLIDFLFRLGSDGLSDQILKENKVLYNKVKDLCNYLENEEKVNLLKQELGESLITFDIQGNDSLVIVQLNDFFGEVEGIKLEIKNIRYREIFS